MLRDSNSMYVNSVCRHDRNNENFTIKCDNQEQ